MEPVTRKRNFDQEFRLKRLLAEKYGLTMAGLARALNQPQGSVANNIYGYRADPMLQARIAAFLGREVAELFPPAESGAELAVNE